MSQKDEGKDFLFTESLGERNLIHILKWLDDIRNIQTQPKTFAVFYEGSEHSYVPDVSAENWTIGQSNGPINIIFEEKTKFWFQKAPGAKERIAVCRSEIESLGYKFVLVFEDEIERARNNIQRMMVIARNIPLPTDIDIDLICRQLPAHFSDVEAIFGTSAVLAALGHRKIYLSDLHQRLNHDSVICLKPYLYENIFS